MVQASRELLSWIPRQLVAVPELAPENEAAVAAGSGSAKLAVEAKVVAWAEKAGRDFAAVAAKVNA